MAVIGLGNPTGITPVHKRVPVRKSPVFGPLRSPQQGIQHVQRQAARQTAQARRPNPAPYVPRLAHPTPVQRRAAQQIVRRPRPLPLGPKPRTPHGLYVQPGYQDVYGPRKPDAVQKLINTKVLAPGLKVLAQTARPIHGVAEATDALIRGHNALRGLEHGLTRDPMNGGVTFSNVLADLGVHNKAIRGIAGFGLDVAADPTTYLTAGAAPVLRKVELDAGEAAARRALRAGLTRDQAEAFRARAVAQAARKAPVTANRSGVFVKVGGRELPGVRRATARVGASAPVRRVAQAGPVRAARSGLSDLNPGIAPEGIAKAAHADARGLARTARASQQRAIFRSRQQAIALSRRIPREHYQNVIDAIEANDLNRLPGELRAPAKRLQDQFRYTLRLQRQAGIGRTHELVTQDPATDARGYFPHALAESLHNGQGFQGGGARQITVDANRGRAYRQPLADLRETHPGLFSENAPLVYANRLAATHRAVSKAELNRNLARVIGRPARAGEATGEHEGIFKLNGSDLTPVDRLPARATGGQYVVLDKRVVEQAHARLDAVRSSGLLRGYDRVQGGFKRIATGTPGFHVRNLIGDLQNAYLGQPARHLAVNLVHSRRAIARLSKGEAKLTKTLPGDATLNATTRGVKIKGALHTYDQLAREAEKVGAIRQGFIGRELEELGGADRGLKGIHRHGDVGRAAKRWMQNREDLVRLATYIGARKRGLNPEAAAAEVARYHFDYGDLTGFERNVARRVLPFYTFSARDIPLQLKSVVTRPGKYAAYQKVLEESSKGFGFAPNYQGQLSEYDQRNLGIPVNALGGKRVLGVSLPLTDINEFPTTVNPKALGNEYARRFMSLVTPLIKDPLEYGTNYSFFFRRAIESPDAPLVPAPGWVAHLGPNVRAYLGVVPDLVNKRTGKKTWGWPGKVNYLARTIPGAPAIIQNLATQSNRAGQTQGDKLLGAVGGVRAAPFDTEAQQQSQLNALYQRRDQLNRQRSILNQRGIRAENATPEYRRVSRGLKDVSTAIVRVRQQRGDKIISGAQQVTAASPLEHRLEAAAQRAAKAASGSGGGALQQRVERAAQAAAKAAGR